MKLEIGITIANAIRAYNAVLPLLMSESVLTAQKQKFVMH
jgi:hypothetical protein